MSHNKEEIEREDFQSYLDLLSDLVEISRKENVSKKEVIKRLKYMLKLLE